MPGAASQHLATFTPGTRAPVFAPQELLELVAEVRRPLHILRRASDGATGLALGGTVSPGGGADPGASGLLHLGTLPSLYPEWLGDRSFAEVHGTRFPYVVGAMANGIATAELVIAAARAGVIGFFGAGGLGLEQIERGIAQIRAELDPAALPWGSNLIHMPAEPEHEAMVVDLYLRRGVRRVSASAYMKLTPAVVRYAASGLSLDPAGRVVRKNHVFAKISRPEVARLFLSPPPAALLHRLQQEGLISAAEAKLAARVPLCDDVTVEADSGGHTDNRPLLAMLPVIKDLRARKVAELGYRRPVRVGAAGGLGSPDALAAAFAAGADYVLTGTVNQAAVESGLSPLGRELLAAAGLADVTMAPSPDMFELGVKVQVLKRGTLFAGRAARLFELYGRYSALEELPEEECAALEKEIFAQPLEAVWQQTERYFQQRNPAELERASRDPHHRMALLFRWYLGNSSSWAISGEAERQWDYQIWCGPAMGAFNTWTADSFLAQPEQRTVGQIARNLLEGAAVITRAHQVRCYGAPVPAAGYDYRPRPLS